MWNGKEIGRAPADDGCRKVVGPRLGLRACVDPLFEFIDGGAASVGDGLGVIPRIVEFEVVFSSARSYPPCYECCDTSDKRYRGEDNG